MTTVPIFFGKCRLCLKYPGSINIKEVSEDIYLVTGIKTIPLDNLPQNICLKCAEIIANAKELREIAINNNTYLHSILDGDSDAETYVLDNENSHTRVSADKITDRNRSQFITIRTEQNSTSISPIIAIRKDLFVAAPSGEVSTSTNEKDKSETCGVRISKRLKFETDRVFEFECEACNKVFDTRKKLYLHERVHNKKISCPVPDCMKLFTTKGDLNKHLRTHTGIRPYVCNICDKKFTQKVTLKLHKENVHFQFNVT